MAKLHTLSGGLRGWLIKWVKYKTSPWSQTYVGLLAATHIILCGTNRTLKINNNKGISYREHPQNILK